MAKKKGADKKRGTYSYVPWKEKCLPSYPVRSVSKNAEKQSFEQWKLWRQFCHLIDNHVELRGATLFGDGSVSWEHIGPTISGMQSWTGTGADNLTEALRCIQEWLTNRCTQDWLEENFREDSPV
jgi:hypothetical protein